ncbi:MAG: KR domain-containing protein [Bryobacteraceae bacterium]
MNSYLKCVQGRTRMAIVYTDAADLRDKLAAAENRIAGRDGVWWNAAVPAGRPTVAFLYPGQGSQYVGMLDGLRQAIPAVGRKIESLHAQWIADGHEPLLDRIYNAPSPESELALRETQRAQPALGLVSLAVAAALREAGIEPTIHAGHSYGELPSLHGAGWLDDRSLLTLSAERGRLLSKAGSRASGGMLALQTDAETAANLCQASGGGAEVVNLNAPRQVVAAGATDSLAALEREASRRGVAAKRLATSAPFHHSSLIKPIAEEWKVFLGRSFSPGVPSGKAYSNATGQAHESAEGVHRWLASQIIFPVQWTQICGQMRFEKVKAYIEAGPGQVLTQLVRRNLPPGETSLLLAADPGKGSGPAEARRHWLSVLAQLWCLGVDVNWREYDGMELQVAQNPTVLGSSRALVERYFDQQRILAELAAGRAANGGERLQIVQAALQSNERIMSEFLAASQALAFERTPIPPPPAPIAPPAPEDKKPSLKEALRAQIAKATGFPLEAVGDGAAFTDLGLDSLSVAEIWGQLLEDFPEITAFAEHMFAVRCIQDLDKFNEQAVSAKLVQEIGTATGPDGDSVFEREAAVDAVLAGQPRYRQAGRELLNAPGMQALTGLLERFDRSERLAAPDRETVERFVLHWERMALPDVAALPDRIRFISPGNGESARRLRALLEKSGRLGDGDRAHIVFLAESGENVERTLDQTSGALFSLAKALPAGVPLTVLSYGEAEPLTAGVAGLVRSLRREVEGLTARYICLTSPPSGIDEELLLRLMFGNTQEDTIREAGRWAERRTLEWTAGPSIQRHEPPRLNSDSRILILGGGDGISSEMGVALAARYGCEISAVGRTPFAGAYPFDDIADGLGAAAEIRRRLFENGTPMAQAAALSQQAVRQRAMWRTRNRVEQAGGRFSYFQGDVGRESELRAAIGHVAGRGPIHGVIHGAGIVRDNRLERKSLDEFLAVVRPKAMAAALLPTLLECQPLEFAVFLSSMTAYTGTAGQTDYAAANEILNASATAWNAQATFPVKSLLWSVWSETGLASPNLMKHMDRMGLGGITTADGLALFLRELLEGSKREDCILLAPRSTLRYAGNATPASAVMAAGLGAGQ